MATTTSDVAAKVAASNITSRLAQNAGALQAMGDHLERSLSGAAGLRDFQAIGEEYAKIIAPDDLKYFEGKRASAGEKLTDVPEVDKVIRQVIGVAHPHASLERRKAYADLVNHVVDACDPKLMSEAIDGRKFKSGAHDKPSSLLKVKSARKDRKSRADAQAYLTSQVASWDKANASNPPANNEMSAAERDVRAAAQAYHEYTDLRAFAAELGSRDNLYSKSMRAVMWQFLAPYWAGLPAKAQTRENAISLCAAIYDAVLKVKPEDRDFTRRGKKNESPMDRLI